MSLRRFVGVFFGIVGAALLAAVLYIALGDLSRHKGRIEALVTQSTGRPFAIDGPFKLKVIPVANYTHDTPYTLPVNPSPNLNTPQADAITRNPTKEERDNRTQEILDRKAAALEDKRRKRKQKEASDLKEYERLKKKFEKRGSIREA